MTIRDALLSMGYHEARLGKWVKPFGFHLFTYSEELSTWMNWFQSGNNEPLVWETKRFSEEDLHGTFVLQIKRWEAYTRINIVASEYAHFEIPRPI